MPAISGLESVNVLCIEDQRQDIEDIYIPLLKRELSRRTGRPPKSTREESHLAPWVKGYGVGSLGDR